MEMGMHGEKELISVEVGNWRLFAKALESHIKLKGRKYNKYKTFNYMSDMFCIDSIIKYAIETKMSLELGEVIDEATLFSIAHYAEVLNTRAKARLPKEVTNGEPKAY